MGDGAFGKVECLSSKKQFRAHYSTENSPKFQPSRPTPLFKKGVYHESTEPSVEEVDSKCEKEVG